jgi:ribosomal protein S18 acetylase RimI-like enzyme
LRRLTIACPVVSDGLCFRLAVEAESDLLSDLVFGTDDQVSAQLAVDVYGARDREQLRPLFRQVWRSGQSWRSTWVAVNEQGDVVGLVKVGASGITLDRRIVTAAVRSMRWRAVRLPSRLRLAAIVIPTKPAGSFVVDELHVVPSARGRGVGAHLLAHAEDLAIGAKCGSMSLDTYVTNPARRLYERAGFRAMAETSDIAFEQLTGIAGRVLYVKSLVSA